MRGTRVAVTVSPEMMVALQLLAGRSGLLVSAQAMVTLRQALDRTINSAECQALLRSHLAHRTVRQWREERFADRQVAIALEQVGGQ